MAAPKTDVLELVNGDRLTGEVKSMAQGVLSFKTDATGTIDVEWSYVARLQTRQYLEVELGTGLRYLGHAPEAKAEGKLRVAVDEEDEGREVPLTEIVRIATIEQGKLLDRIDGYVTGGYDYTKATDIQQLTLSAGINARTPVRSWAIDGSSTSTFEGDEPDTKRFDIEGNYRRFLANRRFVQGYAEVEANDELGLDLRTTLGAGYGLYFRQTSYDEWYGVAGLALVREDFASERTNESVEAALATGYTLFRFKDPEASLDASLQLLPSLTESGRVRSEGRVRGRIEIVEDLFFELSLYGSYDSDPDKEADSNSDYGLTTSLGYSF